MHIVHQMVVDLLLVGKVIYYIYWDRRSFNVFDSFIDFLKIALVMYSHRVSHLAKGLVISLIQNFEENRLLVLFESGFVFFSS